MSYALTFKEVTRFVKDKNRDPKLIEAIDTLLGAALVLAPAFLTLPGSPLPFTFSLLSVKNELVKAGKAIYERLIGEEDESSLDRYRRMEAAYGLICFTAFFTAVEELFSDAGEELQLEEQRTMARGTLMRLGRKEGPEFHTLAKSEPGLEDYKLYFPHPADASEELFERLLKFYTHMCEGFINFLKVTSYWEGLTNERRARDLAKAKQLPTKALEQFRAQYYALAAHYPLFYVWANLQEHEQTRLQVAPRLEELLKSREGLDIGLRKLGELIESLPARTRREGMERVFIELRTLYGESIEEPVLRDPNPRREVPSDGMEAAAGGMPLTFPNKSTIFVPQSFKVMRYSGSERLEHEATWNALESHHDLEVFLYSYFSSPHSASTPLIILGHPGSGKSLLTQMLAARIGQRLLTPVRVELRDINAESEISNQIEGQIYKDTRRQVGWAELMDHFPSPPLIIFDGYDELLQASGKVFADYPQKVQNFQLSEQQLKRGPVHTIITSRLTLINKAAIPEGSTVILLESFDEERLSKWISVWNGANTDYFRAKGLSEFEIPDDKKIRELAEQPLLLLMLALYDSQANELREQRELDRTVLYDNLIRRFIRREKEKDVRGFLELPPEQREEQIDEEVWRLGVVAIGMFNRRSLYIHARELDDDLKFYELEKPLSDSSGRNLTHSQLLLGSFFFVNQSKAAGRGGQAGVTAMGDSAYEFLHNTFGEFLTADFILRSLLLETDFIRSARLSTSLRALLDRRLRGEDDFPKQWFANLMYTPLHSRTVILSMMREWVGYILARDGRHAEDFIAELDVIITSELSRVISKNHVPMLMTGGVSLPFGAGHPFIGHLAIYTLNLVLLRTMLSPSGYVFDEPKFRREGADEQSQTDKMAWDRLTHLWRAWFSLESLEELASVIETTREGEQITLVAATKPKPVTLDPYPSLARINKISTVLADNAVAGISGLLGYDRAYIVPEVMDELALHFHEAELDLDALLIIKRLQTLSLRAEGLDRQQLTTEFTKQYFDKSWIRLVDLIEVLLAFNSFAGPHNYADALEQILRWLPNNPFSENPLFLSLLIPAAYKTRDYRFILSLISQGSFKTVNDFEWVSALPPEVAVTSLEMFAEASNHNFGMLLDKYLSSVNIHELWREWPNFALRLFRLLYSYPQAGARKSLTHLLPPADVGLRPFLMEDALELMRALWVSGGSEAMHSFFITYFIQGERLHLIPINHYPSIIIIADEIGETHWLQELLRGYSDILSSAIATEYGERSLTVDLPLKSIPRFLQLLKEHGIYLGEQR